ncbi:beta-ketoacyl reductase, partial [Streptomyces sp. 2MCAF27]
PKANTAYHLHHLTNQLNIPLTHFILYSSAAGQIGNTGQANYAAANTFLDALATHRHTHNQPATSIAWGLWNTTSQMTQHMDEDDIGRLGRNGMVPMSEEEGLALFDQALAGGAQTPPVLVALRTDPAGLRAQAQAGVLPPMLRGLVRTTARRGESAATTSGSFTERLVGRSEDEQHALVMELVRNTVAAVLGHESPDSLDNDQSFKDLGFDSLTGVELRNRLNAATGLRLPATLVFDHPSPTELADHLLARVSSQLVDARSASLMAEFDRLEAVLATAATAATATTAATAADGDGGEEPGERSAVAARLRRLLAAWEEVGSDDAADADTGDADALDRIEAASTSEIFDFI